MNPSQLSVSAALCLSESCSTRLPFRFGMVTLERASLCTVRLEIECGGDRVRGYSSDLLVPKWFEKNPELSLEEDADELRKGIRGAVSQALDQPVQSAFDHWHQLFQTEVEPRVQDKKLVYGLGVSLVERALVDAVCRLTGGTLRSVLADGLLGFSPERLHSNLSDWPHAQVLSRRPSDTMRVRHTVGLLDELSGSGSSNADAVQDVPDDGLPVTLREDIEAYDLDLFKIKVGGNQAEDLDRLEAIAAVLGESVGASYEVTLDGNEQFGDLGQLVSTLDRLAERPRGRELVERILYIEQPLARAHSFDQDRLRDLRHLRRYGEIILDEADAEVDSFRRAVALGYRGVSVKNCKGVFRAFANRGLCDLQEGLFQSSEDLTNMPLLPLQQDLATASTLGLTHSERNGHHYFRGLDHLPASDVEAALERHPDLYCRAEGSRASLKIEEGRISLSSIHRAGYGSDHELDMESRIEGSRVDWQWAADGSGSQV